ncbi:MAG: GNAT family N-acetyltransferase [Actinomycetota bacterium]|nr:GNAT family N-acetyltransferase [Actinomycetota bacterium]MDP9461858.1 GNAT family N-acetyltransferase [Actinomycetota bacterium]
MISVVHTAELGRSTLAAARALLVESFEGDFGDEDWEHALGGLHALAFDGDRLVAHGAVVQRRLIHAGRALRAGYVEGVAVAPSHRRRAHASAVMHALEGVIGRAYDLGALSATDDGATLYVARGWLPWRGPTSALTPTGTVRTPEDDDAVFVLPGAASLDPGGALVCDWRDGDVW